MKAAVIAVTLTGLMLGGCATNLQELVTSVKDSVQKSTDSLTASAKSSTSKAAAQKQSVVYEGGAATGTGKPIVIMDDFWADRELMYSGFSNTPIDIKHYSNTSKNRIVDTRLQNRDAFETKAEQDRLMPLAQARQQVLKDAALIAFTHSSFDAFIRPYDFATKAFLIEPSDCVGGGMANDAAGTRTAVRCVQIPKLRLSVDRQGDAQIIEKARNENRLRQYVFYRIKSAQRVEGRQMVMIEPVALRAYDELGNKLLTANFTATEQDKALINSTDWSAFK